MTADEKLAAVLAAVQIDPGHRGLAKDPHDNLFTACRGDFAAACNLLADYQGAINYFTGFPVVNAEVMNFETDGPLGCYFLMRALNPSFPWQKMRINAEDIISGDIVNFNFLPYEITIDEIPASAPFEISISCERAGPAKDSNYYSMRGQNLNEYVRSNIATLFQQYTSNKPRKRMSIAIGDGGNEIGMGKIPHETIVKNIPNGDLIHCVVPADYLIVAGVSNWGAYALAAGVFVLRGEKPPADLFDPDLEKRILEIMVREGPLVDGVTGEQTATVDGLSWEEYISPFNRIREILES